MNGVSNKSKSCQKSRLRTKLYRNFLFGVKEYNKECESLIKQVHKQRANGSTRLNSFKCSTLSLPVIETMSIGDKLRRWVLTHNVTRRSVNDIFSILKESGLHWLPNDCRTILKTPRSINIENVAGGQYWYNGIEKNIRLIFSNVQSNLNLQLNINVDGIPLMKSSATQFWPILGKIHGV